MKSWPGIVVALYVGALTLLAAPLFLLCFGRARLEGLSESLPLLAGVLMVLAAGQAVLLVVPADVARGRPVARRRLLVPVITTGVLSCLLMIAGLGSAIVAIAGDHVEREVGPILLTLIPLPFLWGIWAWVFHAYFKAPDPERLIARLMKGLLRGSILELLVAVPSHIIVRRRDDCCAPAATFAGIVTGLSLMLMSFGPGVLFLFARRFRELRRAQDEEPASEAKVSSKEVDAT